MTSYLDDDDDYPVKDNNLSGIASKRPKHEDSAQKTFMKRDMISKLDRSELEDQFLRLYDENLLLKKHCRKQEEKIKKMATKQLRLVNDKKRLLQDPSAGRNIHDVQLDEDMETLKQRLRELEKQNGVLKLKLVALRQQSLGNQAGRATVYGRVQARIDTGIPHAPPTEARILKSMRIMGPPMLHSRPGRSLSIPNGAQVAQLEDENLHLESINTELRNQVGDYERLIENLKEELRLKQRDFEGELTKTKQKFGDEQRATVQENVDRIRLERELKEKSSSITQLHSQYSNMDEKLHLMKTSHDRVLQEMESLNEQLKEEQRKVLSLQGQLKTNMAVQRQVNESEHRISDLQRECQILKEANEKLVSSAFDLEKEREWRQRENCLKVQIAQLEATLRADVGEKGGILDKLSEERDKQEKLEAEHQQMRIKFFEMKQKHDDLMEKMSFFSKDSAINMQEIEEALVIVKQKQQARTPELEFLQKVDDEHHKDLGKVVKQLQAEHAETIHELEKTRNMLIVQYKINKDYQMEVDIATKKLEENEREYKTRLDEYAQLLDIRASRIRKLEAQLKDVAYGTRQYRIKPEDKDPLSDDEEDLEDTVHLELGQNLFEIHISKLELSATGLKHLGDNEPRVFCTWEFYEFEIQSTPIASGQRIEFGFTSQYIVHVDDFFLLYLQKDSCLLELHQSFGTDYVTVAAGHIRMQDLLEKMQGRLHGTIQLTGVREGDTGISYGTVEYWVRLRVPMEQALRLYRERTKAMGYLESNLLKGDQTTLAPLDDTARIRAPNNVNQLLIHVVGCSNVESRRKDLQPSPYCVYQFFDYADHATQTIPSSNNPHFDDQKTFPIDMTTELDKYLVSQVLKVFVFDETDPNQSHYLGVANIPLIPLSHDKDISGSFELVKNDGTCNGTLDINLSWQYTYLPPKGTTGTKKLMTGVSSAADVVAESVSMLPGEKDDLVQSGNGKKKAFSKPPSSVSITKVAASKAERPGKPPLAEAPVKSSMKKPLPVVRVEKASEDQTAHDKIAHSDEEQVDETDEVLSMKSGSPRSVRSSGEKEVKPAVSSEIVSDEETMLGETQLKEPDLSGGETRPSSRASQLSYISGDSEGVVMPQGKIQKNPALKPSGMDPSDVVTIVVSHVSLTENSPLLTNNDVRMLFVEYHFLGMPLEETETQYSLPKPTVPNKPISFNFTKVFHVDYDNNYERRQYLGGMLLPDDPDNGRIRFTIVSEPLDEDDEDCSDVGAAYVSIPQILANGSDVINQEVPIYDINDETLCIGMLGVSVECLAALRVIERQLRTETMPS